MILVNAIKCRKCHCIVYSRATHDMRYCECEAIAIDGGGEYIRMEGRIDNIELVIVSINISGRRLYDDWNSQEDKYGLIKHEDQKRWKTMRILYMEKNDD